MNRHAPVPGRNEYLFSASADIDRPKTLFRHPEFANHGLRNGEMCVPSPSYPANLVGLDELMQPLFEGAVLLL